MERKKTVSMLLEVLMSSVNSNNVPPKLGWAVWNSFLTNRLDKPYGFKSLVRACRLCEPDKTTKLLKGVLT
ncbi:MAG: hypothetical protein QW614_04320 [Candidatus Caldarchaeum sp.]|uniref:Uncharacterized protein n=1 Tax=Caldiarchaeum subterraneum TaxID=311458 RepID=A0A7C5LDV6_CALS0